MKTNIKLMQNQSFYLINLFALKFTKFSDGFIQFEIMWKKMIFCVTFYQLKGKLNNVKNIYRNIFLTYQIKMLLMKQIKSLKR